MIELAVATLVLAAISDQESESGVRGDGPPTAAVPVSALTGHSWLSMHAEDHVPQIREERINIEIRRLQRLIGSHAEKIERLRVTREDRRVPREHGTYPVR